VTKLDISQNDINMPIVDIKNQQKKNALALINRVKAHVGSIQDF
jgi:hypothetical protein